MNETLSLMLAALAGGALGSLFFGGLWWTVRRGVSSSRPALWYVGSFVLRMGIVLAGFYLVGRDHWPRLLSCLGGFLLARVAVTRLTRAAGEARGRQGTEVRHAP